MPKSLRERREERRTQEAGWHTGTSAQVFVDGIDYHSLPKLAQLADIDQFWAIEDKYAAAALEKLAGLTIAQCAELQAEFEAAQQAGGKGEQKPYEVMGRTALLAIDGPITKKPTSASFLFGGTSTILARDALKAASRDPGVDRVLMVFSSPGGQVDGTAELADDVREFAKPIAAFIDGMCASAAYWIASQSDAIYANRTSVTANIGVKGSPLIDSSTAAAAGGIRVHQVATGALKSPGDPGVPVTAEQVEYVRGLARGLFTEFASAVQTGRNLTDDQIADISDGRAMIAGEALALGLIDGICSFEECLSKFSGASASASTTATYMAHDQARANSAAKETPMNLKETIGRLRRLPAEALAQAELTEADLNALDEGGQPNQTAQVDSTVLAGLTARMDALRLKSVEQAANAWFDKLIQPDAQGRQKAIWNQREGLVATYVALAKADGLQFDGQENFIEGDALKAFKLSQEGASSVVLSQEQIANAKPGDAAPDTSLMEAGLKRAANSGRIKKETVDKIVSNLNGGGK